MRLLMWQVYGFQRIIDKNRSAVFFTAERSVCRKSMFLKQTSNSLPLSPCPLSPGKGDFTGATAPRPCRGLRPCDPIFNIYKRFIDSLTAPPYFLRRSGFMPCPVLTMPIKTDKPPSERRGQRCLYDMLHKLLQQCDLADKRKLLSLSLCGVDDTHNHKYKSEDTAYRA